MRSDDRDHAGNRAGTAPDGGNRPTGTSRDYDHGKTSEGREYAEGGLVRPDERYGSQEQYGQGYNPELGRTGYAGYERGQGDRGPDDWRRDEPDRSHSPRRMPKGYRRTDERIREDVCERLGRSGLDVADVSVDVAAGRVTLQGTVDDRRAKHAIEDCADACMGVEDVDNRIRVRSGRSYRTSES